MKIYVSIPITGRPLDDAKAHAKAIAEQFAAHGHDVITPFDVCPDSTKPYSYCMGRDIEALLGCDAIAIGNEWFNSRGCLLEKAAVNGDLAEFVLDKNELFVFVALGYQLADERSFARAAKT